MYTGCSGQNKTTHNFNKHNRISFKTETTEVNYHFLPTTNSNLTTENQTLDICSFFIVIEKENYFKYLPMNFTSMFRILLGVTLHIDCVQIMRTSFAMRQDIFCCTNRRWGRCSRRKPLQWVARGATGQIYRTQTCYGTQTMWAYYPVPGMMTFYCVLMLLYRIIEKRELNWSSGFVLC